MLQHDRARDASLPTATLVAQLREPGLQQWVPPGGGHIGALNHVVVHGLDATLPLGIERVFTDETMRTILDSLAGDGVHQRVRRGPAGAAGGHRPGVGTHGDGEPVRASAGELVMLLTGRCRAA